MKYNALIITFFCCLFFLDNQAQLKEEDYHNQAAEVRNYVWGLKIKAFDERNIPSEYSKYSKVILAKHEEFTALTKSKIHLVGFMLTSKKNITYTTTTRQLVKINDVAALNDYSEINFQKFAQLDKDKLTTFLGVRVIKPNGKVEEINPDEIVLTDNAGKNKKAKLAVPNLQIGDMIDYFIQTVEFYDNGGDLRVENVEFADEDPILHFSVHVELNNKMTLRYRPLNKAPDFKITHDNDDNILMDAEQNNISPYPINLWMSLFRQVPILRFQVMAGSNKSDKEDIYKSSQSETAIQWYDYGLKMELVSFIQVLPSLKPDVDKYAASYLNANGGGSLKDNSLAVYYGLRHYLLMRPDNKNITVVDNRRNYLEPDKIYFLSALEMILGKLNINAQFVLLPSRYGPDMNDIFKSSDFQLALVTEDNHFYTCESFFDSPDFVPYYLEGQSGISLDYSMRMAMPKSIQGKYTAKITGAFQNTEEEKLLINFNPAEPNTIRVERNSVFKGLMKQNAQRQLLLYEDMYDEERKGMDLSKTLSDELNDSRKGKKIADEYVSAFADARKQWNDNCKQEIADRFDITPVTVTENKVVQSGLFDKKPDFIYDAKFSVNAWVKKAGNNFILEVGKIPGSQVSLKPEARDRKVDVYMPYARTFKYDIQIPVPAGYSVEGLDKLNSNTENAQASFITNAKIDGGLIKISVTKIYKNAFVAVAQWPDLLKILDAATAFGDSKILLKKL